MQNTKNILLINSSPRGKNSFSRKLSDAIVEKLRANAPSASLTVRDLTINPTPHLEEAHLDAFFAPPEKHTEANKKAIQHSEEAVAELFAADAIVIGVPGYNFSIPSVLKAWIDHICRAGRTFRYTDKGPEGLLKNKKVYLAIATGGIYTEGPMKQYDFFENYLCAVLGFLGMTDITTFRAEGLSIPGIKEAALEKAVQAVESSL